MRTTHFVAVVLAATFSFAVADDHHHLHEYGDEHDVTTVPKPTMPMSSSSASAGGGYGHGGHGAPLLELDEAEVLQHHAPDPLSYWAHDIGMALGADGISIVPAAAGDDTERTYPMLMALHVVCMTLSFFAVLPVGEPPSLS